MEATGPYSEILATSLVLGGWQVGVVNPARIKGFSQGELARNKTDRADAALLARFCAAMRPSLWTPHLPRGENYVAGLIAYKHSKICINKKAIEWKRIWQVGKRDGAGC